MWKKKKFALIKGSVIYDIHILVIRSLLIKDSEFIQTININLIKTHFT